MIGVLHAPAMWHHTVRIQHHKHMFDHHHNARRHTPHSFRRAPARIASQCTADDYNVRIIAENNTRVQSLAISTPASLIHQCLTLLRKADVQGFQLHVPHETLRHAAPRIRVGHLHVEEQGPLACCCDVLDTAARRILPGVSFGGHLLRRCRVLSSLQMDASTWCLRVAVTGHGGEEAIQLWTIQQQATPHSSSCIPAEFHWTHALTHGKDVHEDDVDLKNNNKSNNNNHDDEEKKEKETPGISECVLLVVDVHTQLPRDAHDLPAQCHVRHAPETIAAAQLYALQQGDLATAARFDARNHHTATPTSHQPSDDDALFTSMLSWRRLLVHPIYAVLGDADADVRWGPSAMVGPAEAVLECTVRETGFVWRMGLGGDGCWRVLDVMVAQLGLGNEGVEVM